MVGLIDIGSRRVPILRHGVSCAFPGGDLEDSVPSTVWFGARRIDLGRDLTGGNTQQFGTAVTTVGSLGTGVKCETNSLPTGKPLWGALRSQRYRPATLLAMNADELFLATLQDLSERIKSGLPAYDILMSAALVRKLLLDDTPLVHLVNQRRKIRLRFTINNRKPPSDPPPILWSLQDGLDPETAHRSQPVEVTLDGLLSTPVFLANGKVLTIKHVVLYVANIVGAVHKGSARTEEARTLEQVSNSLQVGGYDPAVRTLQAISRVVIAGLEPLAAEVQRGSF